jgi:nucleotide-binding universal stress UspA family protein
VSIKVLLVPVFGDAGDRPALAAALPLARSFGAHVSVLHVERDPAGDLLMIGDPLSASTADTILEAARADIADRAKQAKSNFEAWIKSAKLPLSDAPKRGGAATASWTVATGGADVIARRARLADICVIARPQSDDDDERRWVAIETAITHAGRPIMLAPSEAPRTVGKSIAIAWNGSAEAARAVAAAMPLITEAGKVLILTAPERTATGEDAKHLAASLAMHGVKAEVKRVSAAGDIAKALLGAAGRAGADLLVMGAYSHSRLRELVFGGVTRHVLKDAALPILMVH